MFCGALYRDNRIKKLPLMMKVVTTIVFSSYRLVLVAD